MQVLGFRGFSATAGEMWSSLSEQHVGCGNSGLTSVRGFRLSALRNSWDRNCTEILSLCSSSTSSSARFRFTQRLVLARAHNSGSDGQKPERPKWAVEKEARGIPSTVYRPFGFPDVEKYARGLDSWQRTAHAVGFLASLALVVWLRNLGVVGLVDDTEPLFVEAARQMLLTGDYITPKFNASPRFDKPALIYWVMALSARIFGDKVWAYRLPSCLLAIGLLAGLYVTVLKFGVRPRSRVNRSSEEKLGGISEDNFSPAIIAAAAFALNLAVMAGGSTALSDMLLTANVGGSLLSFFWGYAGRDHSPPKYQNYYLFSAAFLGLACLSSGPAAVILPLNACVSFLLCTGDLKQVVMNELPVLQGSLIFTLINLPWYGMMYVRHGTMFFNTVLSNLSIVQFVRGSVHQLGVRPWWFGLTAMLVMYFPWSLTLPSTLIRANPWEDSSSWKEDSRSKKLVLFAAAWLVSGFVLITLTGSHLSSYLLLAPAVAFLSASHLSSPARLHESRLATGLAPALIYQILAGLFFLLPGMQQASAMGIFAAVGGHLVSKHYNLIGFVILATAGMLATRTEEYSVAYGSTHKSSDENVGENLSEKKTLLPLWVLHTVTMLAMMAFLVTPCIRLVDNIRQAPVRELALRAAEVRQPGEELWMVRVKAPSVVYYSQLPTTFFNSFAEAESSLEKSSVKPESVLVISDVMWKSSLKSKEVSQVEKYHLTRIIVPRK